MKTSNQWFEEYAESHQNQTNKLIHYICVPLIFFSVIGLLMNIPALFLKNIFKLYNPLIENWAFLIGILLSIFFYLRLGLWYFIEMFFVILLCIISNYLISIYTNLFFVSICIFVLAWLGQFYGHKLEGKKPSFIKDLQFLLIGPLWVIQKIENRK